MGDGANLVTTADESGMVQGLKRKKGSRVLAQLNRGSSRAGSTGAWTAFLHDQWAAILNANRHRIALFAPVFLGVGCVLAMESGRGIPVGLAVGIGGAMIALAAVSQWRLARSGTPFQALISMVLVACALVATGNAVGLLRAQAVMAPLVPDSDMPVLVEGWVEAIEAGARGPRLRLSVSRFGDVSDAKRPHYVRFAIRDQDPPRVGSGVRCRIIVRPPAGPVVPDSFDFARRAWFSQLSGVGFSLGVCAPATLEPPARLAARLRLALATARAEATLAILERVSGSGGAFLAAMVTGDRGALPDADHEALRASGLYHLLSVSGLHIGIIAGATFFLVRWLAALIAPLALRVSTRKIAAVSAIATAGFYTFFSGGDPPAVRSWIMSCVALGAILLDRPAVSMRGLAFAALICLLIGPESVVDPGFQMSFAATGGLVALYEAWERRNVDAPPPGLIGRAQEWIMGTVATSIVAGMATAPFAAFHFNRTSAYGLLSNVLSEPFLLLVVAPFGLLAAVLAPFGLAEWPLRGAAWGLDRILDIARIVATWPLASSTTPPAPGWVLVAVTLGLIWIFLLRGWVRWLGVIGVVLAYHGAVFSPRTEVWVAPNGRAVLSTPWVGTSAGKPTLCMAQAGRFDGSRLTDAAGLSDADIKRLEQPAGTRAKSPCVLMLPNGQKAVLSWAGKANPTLTLVDRLGTGQVIGDLKNGATLRTHEGRWLIVRRTTPLGAWERQNAVDDAPSGLGGNHPDVAG